MAECKYQPGIEQEFCRAGFCVRYRKDTLRLKSVIVFKSEIEHPKFEIYLGILFIIFAMAAGLLICFITLRISSNCFIRRLTSVMSFPAPFAMRVRRL